MYAREENMIGNIDLVLKNNPQYHGMHDSVEKELLQHDILEVLKKEGVLKDLVFIGGTSLRLCYNSSRLSEDLDFNAGFDFDAKSLSGLEQSIKAFLESKYEIEVNVILPKDNGSNTSTWKVTLEREAIRPDLPRRRMHIDICALPSFDVQSRSVINHYGIPSTVSGLIIPVQSMAETLVDKMIALAYRPRRIKPRDVWDIVWLQQQGGVQTQSVLQNKLSAREKNTDDFIHRLSSNVEKIIENKGTYQDFFQEMSRFVPQKVAHETLQNAEFWPYVGSAVADQMQISKRLLLSKHRSEFNM
jgi:predicted nucleotidyltransferase component of viral defense system